MFQLNSYLFAFPIHFFGEGAGYIDKWKHTTFAAIVNQSLQVSGCRLKEHDMSEILFADFCPMSASFLTNGSANHDTPCIC